MGFKIRIVRTSSKSEEFSDGKEMIIATVDRYYEGTNERIHQKVFHEESENISTCPRNDLHLTIYKDEPRVGEL